MRTHAEIVAASTDRIAMLLPGVSLHTIRSWRQRGSIPAAHWSALCADGVATLEELATAVPPRAAKQPARAA